MPLSVRSSADDFDLDKLQKDFNNKTQPNRGGLDLFFGKQSNFEVIDPIKDDKINKLQSSVDHLRKELQKDQTKSNKDLLLLKRVENTKRKLAALKIQTWYRKNLNRKRSNQINELEQLFSRKKTEMEKKNNEKSLTTQKVFKNHTKPTNKTSIQKPKSNEMNSPRLLKFNNTNDEFLKESQSNNTVESLLFNLDQIEKESADLLKQEPPKHKDLLNESTASLNGEKMNSILSFLNEASTNESNKFVPKPFKEFSVDFNEFYDHLTTKKETPKQKPTFNTSSVLLKKQNENEYLKKSKPVVNNTPTSARQTIKVTK